MTPGMDITKSNEPARTNKLFRSLRTLLIICQSKHNIDMSENPDVLRAISIHLSRTLEEVGLNGLIVKERRHIYLYMEKFKNIYNKLSGQNKQWYHFGSQPEGATTLGLKSDFDCLINHHDCHIIQDWAEWTPGKINLLMLQDETAPGYCHLQVLLSDIDLEVKEQLNKNCAYDSSDRVIVKNTYLHQDVSGFHMVRNGPARTAAHVPGFKDRDIVHAYKYNSWPRQAIEFIQRRRRHGWPSQDLLQEAVQHGVFIVPVGYKLSPREELEWRLSASQVEQCLMFSLNIVHIKCYVVLKMLMKSFVEPCLGKCISSYHCKTAILYCTENTKPGVWRDDNLLQCIIKCLNMLLTWITDGFCPQFVISEENLFAGKVTVQNRGALMSVLEILIRNNGRLLQVHIDDLGQRLLAKLNIVPCVMPVLYSDKTVILAGQLEFNKQQCIHALVCSLVESKKITFPVTNFVYQCIETLKNLIEPSDNLKLQAVTIWTQALSGWLGSLLASVALSLNMRIPRQALRLLLIGTTFSCAGTLKLASILYCSRDVQRAETILKKLEDHLCRNAMQVICSCNERSLILSDAYCHMMYVLKCKRTRSKMFEHCVRFSSHELLCAPPALRYEMFRSVGDDTQHRDILQKKWMDMAAVDCLPYLYFLQYMTYKQLGQRDMQTRALHNLDRCIREINSFSHIETAWNLLGQCMELEQQPEAAMACYSMSLEILSRNNAANWLVAILCYKIVKHTEEP